MLPETIGKMYKEVDGAKFKEFTLKDHSLQKNTKGHKILATLVIQTWIHSMNGKKLRRFDQKIALAPERKGVKEFAQKQSLMKV